MVYSSSSAAFRRDKHQFFAQLPTHPDPVAKIKAIDQRVTTMDYSFLLNNQQALEVEFSQMFLALQQQDGDNKEQFWFYCYYCASLLEVFYRSYGQGAKEAHYKDIKEQIKQRANKDAVVQEDEESFIESLYHGFLNSFGSLLKVPFHIAQIRDYVAYANLCRLYWVFCRLSFVQGLTAANGLGLIDKLDALLGTHTDIDKIIAAVQAPNGLLNYFSVAFFLMRFMIDGALLIKHTFFPSEAESKTTCFERFKSELYKRHCNFANDLVWATVNFLTNFNRISGVPDPVTGYLTAVFLAFDVAMALYKCSLAKEEYLHKKAQYVEELAQYSNAEHCAFMSAEQRLAHIELLHQQLIVLERNWHVKEATFHFVAAAAALLMMGFSAALIFTTPMLVAGSFFACTVAAAMYFSADSYSAYKEKSFILEEAQLDGKGLALALKEYETARNDFIFTLSKNTLVPMVLITTYALCLPAALALTSVYVGWELLHAYNQHEEKHGLKQLALAAPVDEEVETEAQSPFACCF